MSLKRSASIAGLPDRVDDDAPCCWICFEEGGGPDASGKPLIRNCSCRGTSGFAHLSCAVTFAENKCKDAYEFEEYLADYFTVCFNCEQDYQGEVKYAMAKAEVEFIEREYKNNHMLCLEAMVYRMIVLNENNYAHDRPEREVICSKMLSVIEEVDKDPSLQHDDLTHSMARGHNAIADFHREFGSKENLEKAKEHYGRAKDLYEAIREEVFVMAMEREIRMVVANLNGNEVKLDTTEEIIFLRKTYIDYIERYGENDLDTIEAGIELAIALYNADHTIEAERFLTKLEQTSRRVHGHSHNITKKTLAELQEIKARKVYVSSEQDWFQALRYENDGDKIVVRGPLPKFWDERKVEEEKTLTFESKDIIPKKGTPVVVHGLRLRSTSHLNGKIGELRAFSEEDSFYDLYFEEEGLEHIKVKLENVRILFDLPEKK
jgi:tetratricopeptide (TPR) repeat protein